MSIMCATLSKKLIFFALREKESREVEIFTSASVWYFPGKKTCTLTYIFATIFYMCVCLKKICTSQTCLSDLSYKCQDRSTFDALSLAKVPFALVPFLLKIGSLLTLTDAGFGNLIWGRRGATIWKNFVTFWLIFPPTSYLTETRS